jgi:hypothetical protein
MKHSDWGCRIIAPTDGFATAASKKIALAQKDH